MFERGVGTVFMFARDALYCMCARDDDIAWLRVTHCIVCLRVPFVWLRWYSFMVTWCGCVGSHKLLR